MKLCVVERHFALEKTAGNPDGDKSADGELEAGHRAGMDLVEQLVEDPSMRPRSFGSRRESTCRRISCA
ncbi:MAG TPA: hypothetical protein VGQ18_02570 [Gemmatimonadales bacterium]|jgi:hypothetical protein|nr:hypothetical protein [Gemmatimonadales bacterium]